MKPESFLTENELVRTFVAALQTSASRFNTQALCCEFDFASGRTDILSLSCTDELIAFEAKLKDWRKALRQAWRNTSFVNRAYVVLPRSHSAAALRQINEFAALGVGLCVVDHDGMEIAIESTPSDPVIPWLHNKARSVLSSHGVRPDRATS